jgi:GMP synthase-like glutamine amidotransferase
MHSLPGKSSVEIMPEPLLIVRNISHEGPGLLESVLMEHGIEPHCIDLSKGDAFPDPEDFMALVVLGGPSSANDENPVMKNQLRLIGKAVDREIPYLGICLGMQTLVKAGGGTVLKCPVKEIGFSEPGGSAFRIDLTDAGIADPLFDGLGKSFPVFQLHGETVEPLDKTTEILATGNICPVQAVRVGSRAYGLQCHFELTPEMFTSLLDIDGDLKRLDRATLLRQFEEFRDGYTATGLRLMQNFLRIAGLA